MLDKAVTIYHVSHEYKEGKRKTGRTRLIATIAAVETPTGVFMAVARASTSKKDWRPAGKRGETLAQREARLAIPTQPTREIGVALATDRLRAALLIQNKGETAHEVLARADYLRERNLVLFPESVGAGIKIVIEDLRTGLPVIGRDPNAVLKQAQSAEMAWVPPGKKAPAKKKAPKKKAPAKKKK